MGIAGDFDTIVAAEYDEKLYVVNAECVPLEGPEQFDDEAIRRYREEGFVSVANAYSPDEVKRAVDALLGLMTETPENVQLQYEALADRSVLSLPVEDRQDYVRKFMIFTHVQPYLNELAHKPELLEIARRILGAEPELYQDMALFKPPGIGREKPWHQDHAYFNVPEGTPVVGFWIALDAATVENGCMIFKPGGHRLGALPHFNRRDWQICDSDVMDWNGNVAAPVPAGGALVFDGLTPHGTPMNKSNSRRRALQFHYIPKGTRRTTTEERMEMFGSEGRNVSC